MIIIYLPSIDVDESEAFYRDVMLLEEDDFGFILPDLGNDNVRLRPQNIKDRSVMDFHFFRYQIEKDFIKYCDLLYKAGANFITFSDTPGGYIAIVEDPDGNRFELFCDSFEASDSSIKPSDWPFYNRY